MKETQARVLELRFRCKEELLGKLHVLVQRAADVGQQQHVDAVAVLGPQMEVEVELLAHAGVKK
jgi:hypothetical protein